MRDELLAGRSSDDGSSRRAPRITRAHYIASGPFKGLPYRQAGFLLADPPWKFLTRSPRGQGRSADRHYRTMTFRDILELPVRDLCAADCFLGLWITNPLTPRVEEVMEAWGFKYSSVLFTWVKTNAKSPGFFMGNGYGSRQNTERCYLGRRGEPARISASVRELIIEPRREHSRKPDCTMPRIERLAGDVQRIELFSRTDRKGWRQWGDQTGRWKIAA